MYQLRRWGSNLALVGRVWLKPSVLKTIYYYYFFTFSILWLLFDVNDKLLTQHISGLLTKYKLLYVSNQGRIGARVRAKG